MYILIDIDSYKDLWKQWVKKCREVDELKRMISQLHKELDRKNPPRPEYFDFGDMFGKVFGGGTK